MHINFNQSAFITAATRGAISAAEHERRMREGQAALATAKPQPKK